LASDITSRAYLLNYTNSRKAAPPVLTENFRQISNVTVTENSFSVATYEIDNSNRYRMVDVYTMIRQNASGNVPTGVTIPQFNGTTWHTIPDPFPNINFRWNINSPDRNVDTSSNNRIRVLSGLEITPCMIQAEGDVVLSAAIAIPFAAMRRLLAWTDLSGATNAVTDISFLTTANIENGLIAITEPRIDGADTSATLTIPRRLLINETSTGTTLATTLYLALCIDAGRTGEDATRADRYTNAGGENNHRGDAQFTNIGQVTLSVKAVADPGNPTDCPDCNNLPCRCVPQRPWVWCLSEARASEVTNTDNSHSSVFSKWGGSTTIALMLQPERTIVVNPRPGTSDAAVFNFAQAGMNPAVNNYRIRATGTLVGGSASANLRIQGVIGGPGTGTAVAQAVQLDHVHNISLSNTEFTVDFTFGASSANNVQQRNFTQGGLTGPLTAFRIQTNADGAGAVMTFDTFRVTEVGSTTPTFTVTAAGTGAAQTAITPAGAQAAGTPMTVTLTAPSGQQITGTNTTIAVTGAASFNLTVAADRRTATGTFNMPSSNGTINVNASFENIPQPTFTVTATGARAAQTSISPTGAQVAGTPMTVTLTAPSGQRISGTGTTVAVTGAGGVANFNLTVAADRLTATGTFNMPSSNGTVSVGGAFENIPTYTVTFAMNGGNINGNTSNVVRTGIAHGADATPPADPTRLGFVFNGWDGSYTNVTSTRTLTAQWLRLGAVSSIGLGTISSVDATHLARAVALHSGFALPDLRIGNLRGLNRPPNSNDVRLLAQLLVGFDINELISMTDTD
jgi:hypothetical protein